MAARTPMIAITTSNSINVKPRFVGVIDASLLNPMSVLSTRQTHYEDSSRGCIFGKDGGAAIFCLLGSQTGSPLAFGRFYPSGLKPRMGTVVRLRSGD